MSQPPGAKKMAKTAKRIKPPRICVDSLPTNCSHLTLNMSRSNLSCQSCMCCTAEDEDQTPCCDSLKCEVNRRRNEKSRQTQTQSCTSFQQDRTPAEKCCQIPAPPDPSCPICREGINKLAEPEPPCNECKIPKSKEHSCPLCKSIQASKQQNSCPVECCDIPAPPETSCLMCRGAIAKHAEPEPPCNECSSAKSKEPSCEHSCPLCKSIQASKKQNQTEHSCPACKSQQTTPKIKEKEIRCPSCSQPVAIQMPCCEASSHTVSIMIVPEKRLKDRSTQDDDTEDETKEEPCCNKSETKKEEPCCKRAEIKKKEPCCKTTETKKEEPPCCELETCKSKKPEPASKKTEQPIPCCPPPPCCTLESCKSNKKPEEIKPEEQKGKNGKKAKEKTEKTEKTTCGEECKAMKDDPTCCCVFPPAYKQYSCIGKISGSCTCEKPGEEQKKKDE